MLDAANRSGVVISTVDARGVLTTSVQAGDDMGRPGEFDPTAAATLMNDRSISITDNWDGMRELARATGGLFFKNTNDLEGATRQAVEDLNGYYLLGFSPPEGTFKPEGDRPKMRRTAVKVLRPGLLVRTRAGYFGVPERELQRSKPTDPVAQLLMAAVSPFDSGTIPLRLTALFGNSVENGSYITALLHIPGTALKFEEQPDGTHTAQVEIASFVFGNDGKVADQRANSYTIRLGKAEYENNLRQGFLYSLQHVAGKPGSYQVRAAVRDAGTGGTGSASQYLEVPDVAKGGLLLSSIVLQNGGAPEAGGGPALRVFRPGVPIIYAFQVYNPFGPDLAVQATVYRDGQPVWTGKPISLAGSKPEDPRRQKVAQQLSFGRATPTGEYLLQVVATATPPNGKKPVRVEQTVDFELR